MYYVNVLLIPMARKIPFNLRLDAETLADIRRVAAAQGRSRSSVVREAVAEYGAQVDRAQAAERSALDRLRPFVGIVGLGDAQLSADTHTKYRSAVRQKHRARRSR